MTDGQFLHDIMVRALRGRNEQAACPTVAALSESLHRLHAAELRGADTTELRDLAAVLGGQVIRYAVEVGKEGGASC